MKTLPLFFSMAVFLQAIGTGCAASQNTHNLKTVREPPAKMKVTASSGETESEVREPTGSLYAEPQNSPSVRQLRGKPVSVTFVCTLTGDFNVAPSGDKLLMATWCVEEQPVPGNGITMLPVEDTVITRVPGKKIFKILFKNATVSVADTSGQREVLLRYRDPDGTHHNVLLTPQRDEPYMYSFRTLNPDTVNPIGTNRVIEIER